MKRIFGILTLIIACCPWGWAQDQARTITQTVFDAKGRPAAGAEVFASYAASEHGMLARAVANAQGRVTWTNVPPVRVIVWGQGVPAGVIPADAADVTTPLPAPVPEGKPYIFFFELPSVPGKQVSWLVDPPGENGTRLSSSSSWSNQVMRSSNSEFRVQGGTRFSVLALLIADPCRMACLTDAYAPYAAGPSVGIPLTWREGLSVHGRFVARDGTPVVGVSRLRITPESLQGVAPSLVDALCATSTLTFFKDLGRGEFQVMAPAPGIFRVAVDLFDDNAPVPPACRLQVKDGMKDAVITLPDPLLTAPAGATVSWLRLAAPASRGQLALAAHAPQMPVFGPKDDLLALWHSPAPNTLVLLTPSRKDTPLRTLNLRTVYLNLDGAERPDGLALLPMLPESIAFNMRPVATVPELAEVLTAPCYLHMPCTRLNVWPGRYLVSSITGVGAGWTQLDIPPQGNPVIGLTLPGKAIGRVLSAGRPVTLVVPADTPPPTATVNGPSPIRIALSFDTPAGDRQIVSARGVKETSISCTVPVGAHAVTVECFGAGTARSLAIPQGDSPVITVPAWEPGAAVSGTLLTTQEKPAANVTLQFMRGLLSADLTATVKTDAEGKFTLANIPPGPLMVIIPNSDWCGWTCKVPAEGLQDLTLRQSAKPLILGVSAFGRGDSQFWWVPDSGKPVRLCKISDQAVSCEVLPTPGKLWAIDGAVGRGQYFIMAPGQPRQVQTLGYASSGPSVGLYFPLDLEAGMPGRTTLRGKGDRAWVQVAFPSLRWLPAPELGLVVAQIDAVPPGDYTVLVETTRGMAQQDLTVTDGGGAANLSFPR